MSSSLSLKRENKGLLQRYGVYPSKKFGQNFLIDRSVIKRFLKAAELNPEDIVLEIGPGIGNLTQEIAKRVKKVIAIEKDPKMTVILEETLKDFGNVEVIQGDILNLILQNPKSKIQNPKQIQILKIQIPKAYKVIANLPFYLTAPVIRKFLESKKVQPSTMTLIVQKEVAQRICSRPPKMNFLAVSVQFCGKPEIIAYVSKKSFWPQPKVDGAILRITQIHTDKKTDKHRFFEIVRAGFSQPRKTLLNNLLNRLDLNKKGVENWLLESGVRSSRRAETLEIKEWFSLTKNFHLKAL